MADGLLARPWIVLAAALVVQAGLFFAIQRDLSTADPLYYARYAHDLAFRPSELFAKRDDLVFTMWLGLLVPLALLYRMLGASLVVTNLPRLFAVLGIMAIAYAAAPTPRISPRPRPTQRCAPRSRAPPIASCSGAVTSGARCSPTSTSASARRPTSP